MSKFFINIKAFREALRARENSGDRCWGCPSRDRRLADVDVHNDLTILGLSTRGCEPEITLCPECAVAYMNFFNESLEKKRAREGCRCHRWTLEEYLAFYARRLSR